MSKVGGPGSYRAGLKASWKYRIQALVLIMPAIAMAVALAWTEPALLTVAALLLDYMLLLAAFLLGSAIIALLFLPWPLARALSLLAAGCGAAVAFISVLSTFGADPVRWWGAILAVITCVTSGSLLIIATRQVLAADYALKRSHVVAIGAGLAALLPFVQFWHAASFVPSQQETTLGAAVTTDAVATDAGAHGGITVKITNSGDVGALVLASELITCQRSSPQPPLDAAVMYDDEQCVVEQLFTNRTEVDAKSTWDVTSVLRQPERPPKEVRLVEATVLLWYARQDRLEIGDPIPWPQLSAADDHCSTDADATHSLEGHELRPNSRPQGVVEQSRRLVYLRQGPDGDAYFALQPAHTDICGRSGLPTVFSTINEDVGVKNLRLEYESWLTTG